MNYLTYLSKIMNITQNYVQHTNNYTGTPKDYAFDENMASPNEEPFYCPCNEMIVKRIWGVGGNGTNTIWLESTSPVITPAFTDYIHIMIEHSNDSTLGNVKEGQRFNRGEYIAKSGWDGNVTGIHIHVSVSKGKFDGVGWTQNNKGAWVITGNPQKPEDCFYIDKSFTNVLNMNGIPFQYLPNLPKPVERNELREQVEVIVEQLRARTTPEIKDNNILGFIERGIYNIENVIINDGYTWYEVEKDKWIADNGNYLKVYDVEPPKEPVSEPKEEEGTDTPNVEENAPNEEKNEDNDTNIPDEEEKPTNEEKNTSDSVLLDLIKKIIEFILRLFKKA